MILGSVFGVLSWEIDHLGWNESGLINHESAIAMLEVCLWNPKGVHATAIVDRVHQKGMQQAGERGKAISQQGNERTACVIVQQMNVGESSDGSIREAIEMYINRSPW